MSRTVVVVAIMACASSCRLFGQGVPCDRDDNCFGNAKCGLDGFCGTPGASNGPGAVATLKGRAQCQSSDDCGGDQCSDDGTCAVTTWLDAGARAADVRIAGAQIAFVLAAPAFAQCATTGVGVAQLAQAAGGTFTKHDGECNAFNLAGGDVFAWTLSSPGASSSTVRELAGASPTDVASVAARSGLDAPPSVAVTGSHVLWNDGDVVRATGTSSTIALPEKVDPIFGTVTASVIAADDREIWGVGKSLVIADADPSTWSAAKTFTAPASPPDLIVLGQTRAFLRAAIGNGQQTITSIARDDPASPGVVVDTIDGDNTGLLDIAAAGDNVLVLTNTEVRLYPADGSAHVSIATVSAGFDVAFADGYAWWSDGDTIKRVRLTP